ncbi:MAG: GNAT family N-acetyltransferase [Lachnospiraceae bacterium]|nr:GNAT family N-acetyltransferase [Lachnospiraceae bacterium]
MVRLARREELARVNELRRQVNDVHCEGRPDIFRPGFGREMQELIDAMWEGENSDVLVAVRDDVICGVACVDYVERPMTPYSLERRFYHVNEFCVDENCRRQGVGTELMTFIREHAKEKGFERIELDMWEFNEGARKFYESQGFRTYRRYMELASG